jgi:hypothetical protein
VILRGAQVLPVPDAVHEPAVVERAPDVRPLARIWAVSAAIGLLLVGAFACTLALESFTPGETIIPGAAFRQLALLRDVWLVFLVIVPASGALGMSFFASLVDRRGVRLALAATVVHVLGTLLLVLASALPATFLLRAGMVASALAGTLSAAVTIRARQDVSTFARLWRIAARAGSVALVASGLVVGFAPRDPIGFEHATRALLDPLVAAATLYAVALVTRALEPAHTPRSDSLLVGCAASMALFGGAAAASRLFAGPPAADVITSFFALLLSVPATILVARWLTRMVPRREPRFALAVAAITFFVGALATGLHLALLDLGPHLRGTAFAAGHQVFLLGTIAAATLAAVSELPIGWPAAVLFPGGLAMLAIPRFVAGAAGLPRLADSYLPRFQWAAILSGGGLAIVMLSVLLVAAHWLRTIKTATAPRTVR